jgi:KaiC/GvpD/RAD55 family RecA-like ATPase
MPTQERTKTGVPGLDEITGGGLIAKNLVLLTGTAGTGKTTISTQFLYEGAKKYGENGVYVTFEEPIESIKSSSSNHGMDFTKLEEEGKIIFVKYDPFHIEDIYELIETNIKKIDAKRVVIDSISALGLYVKETSEIRRMIFNISFLLRRLNCSSILISEIPPNQSSLSRFGVEEFVTDNVIVLYYSRTGSQFARAITVWKMRGSAHSSKLHPYKITEKGVVIYPKEDAIVK